MQGLTGVRVYLPDWSFPTRESRVGLYRTLEERLERLERLPDVTAVAAVTPLLPLSGVGVHMPYAYDDVNAANRDALTSHWVWVTPGFFEATGASRLQGREFGWSDMEGEEYVVIVDDRLATRAVPTAMRSAGAFRFCRMARGRESWVWSRTCSSRISTGPVRTRSTIPCARTACSSVASASPRAWGSSTSSSAPRDHPNRLDRAPAGRCRFVRSLLYGVDPIDPATYVTVTFVLVASGFSPAGYLHAA